jgi:hypothetical protein
MRTLLFLLLSGCAAPTLWQLDSIVTGERAFDSKRLICSDPILSPLQFEVVATEAGTIGFLSLAKYRLTSASHLEAQFSIDGDKWTEELPILEGRMRLKLPTNLTCRLIEALQSGKKVDILLDGFEQRLDPERFAELYKQLH